MIATLKIIHLLCLLVGGAASFGGAALSRRVQASGAPPAPLVADTMGALWRMGLAAILVLWLTGIPLAYLEYGSLALGWAFYAKLLGATLVLAAVPTMGVLRRRAVAAGRTPDAERLKALGLAAQLGTVAAIVFAVIAFN